MGKRILMWSFILAMMFFMTGCETEAKELVQPIPTTVQTGTVGEEAMTNEDAYGDILANFYDLIAHPHKRTDLAEGEMGAFEAAIALGDAALHTIGYVFTDLNGDGVTELLIGVFDTAEGAFVENELYTAYTYDVGRPVLLCEGRSRNAYSVMENGSFFYYGSGGAMYSVFGECMLTTDGVLAWKDYYFTYETDETRTEIGFFHNDCGEWDAVRSERLFIDADTFWSIRETYARRTKSFEDTKFASFGT